MKAAQKEIHRQLARIFGIQRIRAAGPPRLRVRERDRKPGWLQDLLIARAENKRERRNAKRRETWQGRMD